MLVSVNVAEIWRRFLFILGAVLECILDSLRVGVFKFLSSRVAATKVAHFQGIFFYTVFEKYLYIATRVFTIGIY